jgi:hypothetical protein
MRTHGDAYEDIAWRDAVAALMAQGTGQRPAWMQEIDRIGTALLNGSISEAAARTRLLANGGTEREADIQLGLWRRPVVSFTESA